MKYEVNISNDHCMDLLHSYYILVPESKLYVDALYEYNIYENGVLRNCFKKMVFNERKYNYIERKLFDHINEKCKLYICMYEEEYIEIEQLKIVKDLTEDLMLQCKESEFLEFASDFLNLVKYAIKEQVPIGLLF